MSNKNMRMGYGEALLELGRVNPKVVALEADLGKSTMSNMFGAEFPDRYFQMGIAEANMISAAAGLALTGHIPFASTFATVSVADSSGNRSGSLASFTGVGTATT